MSWEGVTMRMSGAGGERSWRANEKVDKWRGELEGKWMGGWMDGY